MLRSHMKRRFWRSKPVKREVDVDDSVPLFEDTGDGVITKIRMQKKRQRELIRIWLWVVVPVIVLLLGLCFIL